MYVCINVCDIYYSIHNKAKDLTKFFLNITLQETEIELRRLVDCKVSQAIINLNELLDRPASHGVVNNNRSIIYIYI